MQILNVLINHFFEQILFDHTSRFLNQEPTNITFIWINHLQFETISRRYHSQLEYMQITNVLINPQMNPQATPQEMTRRYYLNNFQLQ